MTHRLFLTLDLEEDGAGITDTLSYECAERAGELSNLLRDHGVRLTVFVSGRLLDERPHLIQRFDPDLTVFENHGYDHGAVRATPTRTPHDNIVKGHEAYCRFFGSAPIGYRAPNGMIASPELRTLAGMGYRFDSSIFPTRFPGRFDWSFVPPTDFLWEGLDLVECPISVAGRMRIPAGISYMQLVGWPVYRRLLNRGGWPERLVVDLHLHDLFPGSWYETLSLRHRLAYWRARRQRPMTRTLTSLLSECQAHGYQSAWLRQHVASLLDGDRGGDPVPRVRLP
jgi:peptidoglycan/xylan/chitin deacetylase (PgdA/CDA1 family)